MMTKNQTNQTMPTMSSQYKVVEYEAKPHPASTVSLRALSRLIGLDVLLGTLFADVNRRGENVNAMQYIMLMANYTINPQIPSTIAPIPAFSASLRRTSPSFFGLFNGLPLRTVLTSSSDNVSYSTNAFAIYSSVWNISHE
jgi:hypothetical protein